MDFQSITQINPKKGSFLKNIDGSIWLYKGIEDAFVQLLCTESSPNSVKKIGDTRKLNTYNAEFLFDWLPYKLETADGDAEEIADTEEEGEMHQLELEVLEQPMTFEKIEIEPTQEQKNLEGAISQLLFTNAANEGDDEEFAEAEEVVEEVVLQVEEEATTRVKAVKNIEPEAATVEPQEPKAEPTKATATAPTLFWHNGRMKKCLLFVGFNDAELLLFEDHEIIKYSDEYLEAYDNQERFTTCGNLLVYYAATIATIEEENSPALIEAIDQQNKMIVTTGDWRLSHSVREFQAILIGGEKQWFKVDAGWRTKVF